MKLSRLYSNKPHLFGPIDFKPGLNVVLGEIRLPENRAKDTHNLGKTTLGRMLDFCFLAKRSPQFFLFKHDELFEDFVFFLEIQIDKDSYLSVRRSVKNATKISFKKHVAPRQDFSQLPEAGWDHADMPFDRALLMLDSLLDWRALKPWPIRKSLGYHLRSQQDFGDVFQLAKFKGKDSEWKPFLAQLLGFDAPLLVKHYEKEEAIEKQKRTAETLRRELGGQAEDLSKIEGLLLLKQQEAEKKQKALNAFDFRVQDFEHTRQLVDEINEQIADLNSERYSLSQSKKKIEASLGEDQILFNPDEAEKLFKEAGILFPGQLKKDFQQLIAFNRAITDERRAYLHEELSEINAELKRMNETLDGLGKKRSETLAFLGSIDVFDKYKQVSDELVTLRADIQVLEAQRKLMHRLQELRAHIRSLEEEKTHLQSQIEADVQYQNSDKHSLFSIIRTYFSEIVEEVISRKALLSVSPNRAGHLEFAAELLDEKGNTTSAALGHTYHKLLCIAFDLAILRAHLHQRFPRFVYHDGVFQSLDDRKKENLLSVIRRYADMGLQPIITLIDSELPMRGGRSDSVFDEGEIVLRLHDENEQGRLFRMAAW